MMLNTTALVIIPTYNEVANIKPLVTQVLGQPIPLHIVIIDDNSPDGTGEKADELARLCNRLSVVHRPCKLGLGTAYLDGFRRALEGGYGYAITMDADFSHNPAYLAALVSMTKEHDIVIGSRYVPGGGSAGCALSRVLLSLSANALARFMLGLPVRDCTAGFRCYRTSVLREIELQRLFSDGYSFLVEMITRCHRRGYKIGELPIIFDNRRLGRSKISKKEILKSIYTIVRLRFF
jgi:dolichol-phosphate mannosyltransferase